MNKQAFKLTDTTYEDYLSWCHKNGKNIKMLSTKKDFFERVLHKRLAKNELTGKLVVKKPRRKK